MDLFNIENSQSTLLWRGAQDAKSHRAELTHLLRRGERAWVSLPTDLLETRVSIETP